ncbi:MAG: histidine kinase [Acidobacteria bacterium]|nr:histidine kinase [Acidobacteriota bacterium]
MEPRLILVTLLVKLGVAAAVASALVRSRYFKLLLFREERTTEQRIHLILFVATPFALGVMIRVLVPNFLAADLGLEAAILMGVIGGRLAGALGGGLVAMPALLNAEYLTLPFNVIAGLLAGLLRWRVPNPEEVWSFSPFIDLGVYRWARRILRHPLGDWQTAFFLMILGLQVLHLELAARLPGQMFALKSTQWPTLLAIYAVTIAVVAIPLKIWNNARIEIKLEEQERLLLQTRMDALQTQINPHFLFNTLNSVSSLVRFDPDMAREVILKLASILRRLLGKHDSFVHLREEVEFIDDYLDIEVVRFGRDKLRVEKELAPETLDVVVPSMILQPLVENSIKHGLSPKVDGGRITLRSRLADGKVVIQVEDDGVGLGAAGPSAGNAGAGLGEAVSADALINSVGPVVTYGAGIGMANVAERLKVLYGDAATMRIEDRPGGGTSVTLELPALQEGELTPETSPVASALYDARGGQR